MNSKLGANPQLTDSLASVHPDELADRRFRREQESPASEEHLAQVVAWMEHCYEVRGFAVAVKQLADLINVEDEVSSLGALPLAVGQDQGVIEVVAGADQDLPLLAGLLGAFESESWLINLLVPLHRLGAAHAACRGSRVDRLQPYWLSGDAVLFGGTEVP